MPSRTASSKSLFELSYAIDRQARPLLWRESLLRARAFLARMREELARGDHDAALHSVLMAHSAHELARVYRRLMAAS